MTCPRNRLCGRFNLWEPERWRCVTGCNYRSPPGSVRSFRAGSSPLPEALKPHVAPMPACFAALKESARAKRHPSRRRSIGRQPTLTRNYGARPRLAYRSFALMTPPIRCFCVRFPIRPVSCTFAAHWSRAISMRLRSSAAASVLSMVANNPNVLPRCSRERE